MKDAPQHRYLCCMLENETHRLRAMEPEDVDLLFDIENDSKEWWIGATMNPIGREALRNFASGQHDLWRDLQLRLMVETIGTSPKTIGAVDLYQLDPRNRRAGVGIVILEEHRGKGHAAQCLELLAHYAFEHVGLHQLWAEIPSTHQASLSVFETAGFTRSGELRDWIRHGDHWIDAFCVQCIRPQTLAKK
jgi:diamine N-acetyltransferase